MDASRVSPDEVVTVGQLNAKVSKLLQSEAGLRNLWVRGELSNWTGPHHGSGHCYFRLKDDRSEIDCVMWRGQYAKVAFEPEDGMEVLARGSPGLYEQRGSYQFYVEEMVPSGQGDLYLRFQQLKAKLTEEGLFADARKRPIPRFPEHVGVVTSRSAAALQDVLNVLRRRSPHVRVTIANCRVQGDGAGETVAQAIQRLDEHAQRTGGPDVLIVCRGGGSMEDLWAFNEEPAVRAVAACRLPVVSGVGHETDWTLVDLAADRRAPTPSAAAEVAAASREETLELVRTRQHRLAARLQATLRLQGSRLEGLAGRPVLARPEALLREAWQRTDDLADRLPRAVRVHLEQARARIEQLDQRPVLSKPRVLLAQDRQRVQELERRLPRAVGHSLERCSNRLAQRAGRLDALSPLKVLARGYAVALHDGAPVRSTRDVSRGDPLTVRVRDGTIHTKVTDTEEEQ